jgi:hypothetical protein
MKNKTENVSDLVQMLAIILDKEPFTEAMAALCSTLAILIDANVAPENRNDAMDRILRSVESWFEDEAQ